MKNTDLHYFMLEAAEVEGWEKVDFGLKWLTFTRNILSAQEVEVGYIFKQIVRFILIEEKFSQWKYSPWFVLFIKLRDYNTNCVSCFDYLRS